MMMRSPTLWIHPSLLLLDFPLQTQNIIFNITNNFKQLKGEPSTLDTTCWEKRVISPLKQNPQTSFPNNELTDVGLGIKAKSTPISYNLKLLTKLYFLPPFLAHLVCLCKLIWFSITLFTLS